ncbi:MAG TPA: hypothetical protein DEP20_01330 [Fusobacteria bacterium]|nr:hypothetical protein [Fusobacteriota bacterium]|tara:strand:- start:308 stop:493 length:186 start_codon:yes stop_codon:yes gene_type:complete
MNAKKEVLYRISPDSVISITSQDYSQKLRELKEKITRCGLVSGEKKVRINGQLISLSKFQD